MLAGNTVVWTGFHCSKIYTLKSLPERPAAALCNVPSAKILSRGISSGMDWDIHAFHNRPLH